ncbi:MAG: pyridoxal phosphate-dependent decarboxylase family protein [Bacteroidia bacterium]
MKAESRLPQKGLSSEEILRQLHELKNRDTNWRSAKIWSLVYYKDEALLRLIQDVYSLFISENALNPMAFPSLRYMQNSVVSMVGEILHAPAQAAGVMTSGGTESLFLVVLAAWQHAKKRIYLHQPQIVAPITVHPAIDKAAYYLGIKVVHVPVDEDGTPSLSEIQKHLTNDTILLVGSAPSYPHGTLDPIVQMAELAQEKQIPFHVDACIGGMMLPFLEELGYELPLYDFRVEGVTSMSVDLHKYGYAAKGASVVIYRDKAMRRNQFFAYLDWPGGIYASPTFLGTKSGGAIASAWAVLQYMGKEGYKEAAQICISATQKLLRALAEIPELYVVGKPCMSIVAFGAYPPLDIYVIADELAQHGWYLDRQQYPPSLHMTITYAHAAIMEDFIASLREVVDTLKKQRRYSWQDRLVSGFARRAVDILPAKWSRQLVRLVQKVGRTPTPTKRMAALYGMLSSFSAKGNARDVVLDFLDKALEG